MSWILMPSYLDSKKWMILPPDGKPIHFGQKGYTDFTINKDEKLKARYIKSHGSSGREKWGIDGINTAGFWAVHLLWNLPTLESSIKDIERKFGIRILLKKL
jgi:hypothetical protein